MGSAKLLYIDGDKKECDMCNKKKITASIEGICGDVFVICKECLKKIIKKF